MNTETILKELQFKGIRSSGAGGQHVNKVSSKIELTFNLNTSLSFSESEKRLLLKNLASRFTKEAVLIIFCDEHRSQHRNKEIAIKRFLKLINEGLIIPKKRRPTKPSFGSIQKKAQNKRKNALKKSLRQKPRLDV